LAVVRSPTIIRQQADHPTAEQRASARRARALQPGDLGITVVGRARLQRTFAAGEEGVAPSGQISHRHVQLARTSSIGSPLNSRSTALGLRFAGIRRRGPGTDASPPA
jgi:hypothetical protein